MIRVNLDVSDSLRLMRYARSLGVSPEISLNMLRMRKMLKSFWGSTISLAL